MSNSEDIDERVRMVHSMEHLKKCATSAKEAYKRENDTEALGELYELRGRLKSVMERVEE